MDFSEESADFSGAGGETPGLIALRGIFLRIIPSAFLEVYGRNGYLVGSGSNILRTSDAGETWTLQVDGDHGLFDVAFADSLTGLAVGGWTIPNSQRTAGLVLRTSDGGENWVHANTLATAPSELPLSVDFMGGDTCILTTTGGQIYKSVNAGTIWRLVHSGTPGNIVSAQCFVNSFCYALSSSGILLQTFNGEDWTRVFSDAGALQSFHFPNPATGYAVGVGGAIIKITNPNPTSISIRGKDRRTSPQAYLRGDALRFDLPRATKVEVRVFDARGRLNAKVLEEVRGPGMQTLTLPGFRPAPLLFIELRTGVGGQATRQIIPWF